MSETSRVVYFNGELVPEAEARLSIYDSALMFGDMVFEMTRSFNQQQFKLREHLERLYASMKAVHIPDYSAPQRRNSIPISGRPEVKGFVCSVQEVQEIDPGTSFYPLLAHN